jgi:heptaprenyl diphosphate synthase
VKSLIFYKIERQVLPMKTKKITLMALLTAIALTIFMVEARIPALVPIPGVKLGLSNIVTVFAVFALGPKEAAAILFCRIFLGSVFAGNFSSILYSASGGTLAILVTIGLRKILTHDQLWVAGSLSAVGHSIGQMAMAIAVTSTPGLAVYLPMMIGCSVVTGLFTGLCAQLLLNRGKEIWKTFLK